MAGAAAGARRDDVPADVGDAGRPARDHRGAARNDRTRGRRRARAPAARAAGVRVPRDAAARDDRRAGEGRARADLPRELHAAGRGRPGAEPDERRRVVEERQGGDPRGAGRRDVRHALREGLPAVPAPRHRHPPRGPAAEVPAARRAARAEGAAQGRERHRHAGRRRERADPDGAVHAAVQVRRREDGHPRRARVPADRRTRGPEGLRRARVRGRAGARARRREQAARDEGGAGQEGGDAQAADEGLRALRSRHVRSPAGRDARAARVALRGHARGPAVVPAGWPRHRGGLEEAARGRLPSLALDRRALSRRPAPATRAEAPGRGLLPHAAPRRDRRTS